MKQTGFNSNRNLILFFAITLLWTWIAGFIPLVFGLTGTTLGTVIFYFGGGAPSVVALFLVFKTYPRQARRDYFSRCFNPKRAGWKWPLFTVLWFVAITAIGLSISVNILGYEMPEMLWLRTVITQPYMLPVILLLSLVSGPLNEEFGWRGYSLDRLFVRLGFCKASVLLGFIWAIWHLAWYFTPGQAQYNWLQSSLWDAFIFLPSTIGLTFVVSFVYINTGRSILAGAFVHMMSNFFTSQLIAPYDASISRIIIYVGMAFASVIVIYTSVSKNFKARFEAETGNILSECERFEIHCL